MSAGKLNITIEQGATWSKSLLWTDDGVPPAPVDLTGRTARMQIRQAQASRTAMLELTTENGGITLGGAAGTIDILATAEQSATLKSDGVYDLEIVTGDVVERLLQGKMKLSLEVTR